MLRGIDISGHQASINWDALDPVRTAYVIIKATGGGTFVNSRYHDQVRQARAHGRLVGHYHYAHELTFEAHQPQGRYSPEQEADHFVDTIDYEPGDVVALDIEDPDAHGNLADWALRWLRRVEERLGVKPLVYTYPSYVTERGLGTTELAAYPLWQATYYIPYRDTPSPRPLGQWEKWTIWQWSGGTPVAGIVFPTDENVFDGTREEFLMLGGVSAGPLDAFREMSLYELFAPVFGH